MDVRIIPLNGCLWVALAVLTLGVAPLAIWLAERSWPRRLDEAGLETRGGRRILWSEFTRIRRVITQSSGVTTEHYELQSKQGKVRVAVYRLVDGPHVLEYILQRLPPAAIEGHETPAVGG